VGGYLTTRGARLQEMEEFFAKRESSAPVIVAGDFNDGDNSPLGKGLEKKELVKALSGFERHSPTWERQTSVVHLHRRMDHVMYPPELHCCSAKVLHEGASDHFPVEAVFTRQAAM